MKYSIEQTLKKNNYVVYPITGFSMYPLLKNGEDRVVLKRENDYKIFDVILFKRTKNTYVLHRIIDICNSFYYVIGDNANHVDCLKKEQILARMTEIISPNKTTKVDSEDYSLLMEKYLFKSENIRKQIISDPKAFFYVRKKEAYYELLKLCFYGKYDEEKLTRLTLNELCDLCELLSQKKALHLLGFAIEKFSLTIDENISKVAVEEFNQSILRRTRFDYAISSISNLFSNNKIKHIFLKGSEIKDKYKFPFLRISNDIDIYIDKNDFELSKNLLVNNYNGEFHYVTPHDEEIVLNSLGVKVELHHSIATNLPEDLHNILSDPFKNAIKDSNGDFRYHLSKEDEIIFFLSHNAKHINVGQFWFTAITDYNMLNIDSEHKCLMEARLFDFNIYYSNIVNSILNDGILTKSEEHFEDILLMDKNEMDLSIQIGRNNKFKYIVKRIFPPYKALKQHFPILEKFPILLPFVQIYRIFKIIFHTSLSGKKEIHTIKTNTKSIVETLCDVGLSEYIVNPNDHKSRF